MSIQIYKPNKSNTGFAFSFYIAENQKNKTPTLFINAIAQHSWDDSKRLGSFSGSKENPEKNISIKFNEFECGAIISAISNRYEWNTYHAFEDNKTQIRLTPWDKEVKSTKINQKTKEAYETKTVVPAFGITITRNGNQTFKIPLEPGEAECIKILCETVIRKICEKNVFAKKEPTNNENYDF
ncbi:MAG: hypothetical protein EBY39_11535 [Flavobacteriia bacterium]|nr:hypothetical protein [Flavobacteriia bacterium]